MSTTRLMGHVNDIYQSGALLCYGEPDDNEYGLVEACISVQVDANGAVCIGQMGESIVTSGTQVDELIAELRAIRKTQKDAEK